MKRAPAPPSLLSGGAMSRDVASSSVCATPSAQLFVTRIARYTYSATMLHPLSGSTRVRSEEHTSELQSRVDLVCRLLLAKKKKQYARASEGCKRVPARQPLVGVGIA